MNSSYKLYAVRCVVDVPVNHQTLEMSDSEMTPPDLLNHVSPNQHSTSPVHQPVTSVSVIPVFSASSPSHHRSLLTTVVQDPASCPIIPGCETAIEINKGKSGLGLSIVGGSDTLLVCVFFSDDNMTVTVRQ